MENSTRNVLVLCSAILLFGVSMRVQSGQDRNEEVTPASVGNVPPKPIPNSDFNVLSHYAVIPQQPIDSNLGGTPTKDLIKLNQGGATVPGITKIEDDTKPVAAAPVATSSANVGQANGNNNQPRYGDYGEVIPNPTTGNAVLDTMAGSLSDEDQASFAVMWATLSPAQREQFMSRLQNSRKL